MASCESTYDERLGLADSLDEYKDCFSDEHYELLVQEALNETSGGAGKLKYILALARRSKTGTVSRALLAKKVHKEYSPSLFTQEQKGGEEQEKMEVDQDTVVEIGASSKQNREEKGAKEEEQDGAKEAMAVEYEDMDTDIEEADDQQDDQEDDDDQEEEDEEEEDDDEEQAPHVDKTVKKIIEKSELTFFKRVRWPFKLKPFVLPGEGYWVDAHNIETFRASTPEDLAIATPKPMPVHVAKRNPFREEAPTVVFQRLEKAYHLCQRVAVSFDGEVYRATDGEIEAALQDEEFAPSCSAATYVKAVQEVRRRHAIARAGGSGSG